MAPPDAFARIYPALLNRARGVLSRRHLRHSLAEDLIQEALARWLRRGLVHHTDSQTKSWLGRTMELVGKEWSIRSKDPLDHHPASLDQPWARGDSD